MTLKPLTDRDLIVLIIVGSTSVAMSVVDAVVTLANPTRSFLDFAILFSFGWGLYWLGKQSPS